MKMIYDLSLFTNLSIHSLIYRDWWDNWNDFKLNCVWVVLQFYLMKINQIQPPKPLSIEKYTWKWELYVIWYGHAFIFDFELFYLGLNILFFNIRTTPLPGLFIYFSHHYWNVLLGNCKLRCRKRNFYCFPAYKEVKTLKRARIALHPDKERLEQCKTSKKRRNFGWNKKKWRSYSRISKKKKKCRLTTNQEPRNKAILCIIMIFFYAKIEFIVGRWWFAL